MRHVLFRVERDHYALPLDAVREVVVAPERYTRVPHASGAVKGVVTLRGRVVPVVELAALLTSSSGATEGAKVVLLELARRDLGLLVTEVDGIEPIEPTSVQARPSTLVKGVTRVGSRAVSVLDLHALDAAVAASFVNG